MNSLRRGSRSAAAAALLVLTTAACAPVAGSPGPTAAPGPTGGSASLPEPSPVVTDGPPAVALDGSQATMVETPFASRRYDYALSVPPGWTINEAAGSGGLHPDEPGVDTFRDRYGHILSIVGEPATSLTDWTSPISQHLRGEHALTADSREDLTVAGVPARLAEYHLPIPPSYLIHYLDADLVNDGVGLVLSLESTTRDDPGDRAVLDRFLSSLTVGSP